MPDRKLVKKYLLKVDLEPEHTAYMRKIKARFETLAMSEAFINAAGKKMSNGLNQINRDLERSARDVNADSRIDHFATAFQIKDFLQIPIEGKQKKDGKPYTVLDGLKDAAKDEKTGVSLDSLFDDLYYLDSITGGSLNMPELDPESVPKKKKATGTLSWGNYCLTHLENIPHTRKGKEDFLAKAMVGAYYHMQEVKGAQDVPAFSVSSARKLAEKLKADPAFKQMCKNQVTLQEKLSVGIKDPARLSEMVKGLSRPFDAPKKTQDIILKKLKTVLPLLDPPEGRSEKWQKLVESIETIDLDDPENSGEKKLKEIFERGTDYMKGKKSLRDSTEKQNRFDQAMDIVATVCEASEYAKYAGNVIIDRINEVRLKHDSDYNPVKLVDYGVGKIAMIKGVERQYRDGSRPVPSHTNEKDILKIKKIMDELDPPENKARRNPTARKSPYKIQGLPKLPFGTPGVKPGDVRSTFMPFFKKADLSVEETKDMLVSLLAYSKATQYDNRYPSAKNPFVFKESELTDLKKQLAADPAVKQLAEKYQDPKNRAALIGKATVFSDFDLKKLENEFEQIKKPAEQGPVIK